MVWYFTFFLVSGFCSLVYEMVWLRLAMAQFGVTSQLISIVLSTFMAGLGLGSLGAGLLTQRMASSSASTLLRVYALLELVIGLAGNRVPGLFSIGRDMLQERASENIVMGSNSYYLYSGLWLVVSMIPWCICMGATLPVAMSAIRKSFGVETRKSFSFLYLANVLGAVLGTVVPVFVLIEVLGFQWTLGVASSLNILIAVTALALSLRLEDAELAPEAAEDSATQDGIYGLRRSRIPVLLFATGFITLGMEVVWVRQFTPYVGTVVYAFATILGLYLAATYLGSQVYRIWIRKHEAATSGLAWILFGLAGLTCLVGADPRMPLSVGAIRVAIGIVPVSFLSGFVMPLLVDRWSSGDAGLAGKAYAVNVLGSILGPIFASFVLMPRMSEAWSIIVLSLPLFAIGLIIAANMARQPEKVGLARHPRATMSVVIVASLFLLLVTQGFEEKFPQAIVLRDSTATVIGIGDGMKSQLLINGYGTTGLTPDTKMMAHLPLAFLQHRPKDALVICFGMGTTYRSLLSWGINATAVELVPSVPLLFENFHPDGSEVLNSPRGKIVIDDGRRFLERSHQQYDVITIDPPPPTEAAGSSLLYSVEFCRSLRDRLRPGGILQHWFPGGDAQAAIARTIKATFTYVRVFPAIESAGLHFIASMSPIAEPDASTLSGRMPPRAREDFVEYGPAANAEDEFNLILKGEYPIDAVIMAAPYFPIIEDDRPVNEYYFLRRTFNVFWIIGGSMGDEEEDGL